MIEPVKEPPKLRGMRVVGGPMTYVIGVVKGVLIFGFTGYSFAYMLGFVHGDDTNVASRICDRFPKGAQYRSALAYARDVVASPSRIEENSRGFKIVADFPDPAVRPICEIIGSHGEVKIARYYRGKTY